MGAKLTEFIRDYVFIPRLKKRGCMVVYDPDRRYQELCRGLGSESVRIVDASESSLESRRAALQGLSDFGNSKLKLEGLLVYFGKKDTFPFEQQTFLRQAMAGLLADKPRSRFVCRLELRTGTGVSHT